FGLGRSATRLAGIGAMGYNLVPPKRHGEPRSMRNFLRCVRTAWRYRRRLALSLVCAILAAACWSLNFGALHPVLKILGGAKSLPDSVQIDIDQAEAEAKAHFAELERWCKEASEIDWIPETARDERSRYVNGKIVQTDWKLRRDNLSINRLQLLKSIYT